MSLVTVVLRIHLTHLVKLLNDHSSPETESIVFSLW
ncbi:hypothetical protein AALP_AA1G251800 [Arabis alpina]|uniref:Uncharacterized protein n=1 Tax=Arabis alpina TaxID=50452 RepID=A0A087HQJ2_ARAAL|nr:hypothetical protein AALP_AA1G251800 [Arabis alpina]